MCGEKGDEKCQLTFSVGSPPRVRGEAFMERNPFLGGWITPACAGRRQEAVCPTCGQPDHPRVCGEKFIMLLLMCAIRGSPPRVRGEGCGTAAQLA